MAPGLAASGGAVAKGSGEPFLSLDGVGKVFGEFHALKNISLSVHRGEFVCFLGPSGCGKTTALRVIAGLEVQSQGSIRQDGRDISTLPPSQRDFGIVFQSYALFPNLTVERNVGFGLRSLGLPRQAIDERAAELLHLVGLADQVGKYPAQLSGGEQQRVALARALAMSPGLLLLDEPLSALDAGVRTRLRQEIRGLQRRLGVTTIMVTHDQEEALTMADRIVVMNRGAIEQIGTPLDIYRRPVSRFVAEFVGATNLLRGHVVAEDLVRVGSFDFCCRPTGLRVGRPVTISIRPEDIVVRSLEHENTNLVSVKVVGLEFLGSFYRARLCLAGTEETEIAADFSSNEADELGLAVAREIRIMLPAERIRVFHDAAR
jgi:iron(III) transport system ATP-binding protein